MEVGVHNNWGAANMRTQLGPEALNLNQDLRVLDVLLGRVRDSTSGCALSSDGQVLGHNGTSEQESGQGLGEHVCNRLSDSDE